MKRDLDVLGLGSRAEKIGERRARHGRAGLQTGHDPVPPKRKLGIFRRRGVGVDEHHEIGAVAGGGSTSLLKQRPC